ncbi:endonuclease/exonuclease/phosphatase [Novosphingobium sp. Rr 2-17]|uniref:endonuclease/exonuclease/phosphatase family protein n=1 Tax=Novosphingobium sp. Rr 2-17 TaxID=555793 RepID=UPI0002697B30|nr:endonuclease/exonuclease/phosphatase family protein [Novosphingobium sp. Rr 2-17]EIZ80217.1 endonuclease/exonuclease/phosphatase [Novosphingobium sp. Rr 2-17]
MYKSRVVVFAAMAALAAGIVARPLPAAVPLAAPSPGVVDRTDLSVMTYNVEGLPFPVVTGRPAALAQIGDNLLNLRQRGLQPHIVALQEAFIPQAKAIAERAGYRYVAYGPTGAQAGSVPIDASTVPAYDRYKAQSSWLKGETEGKFVDSGLVIMSDYPIVASRKMAFPQDMCAGYDCLAAKGVLVAWVQVPGHSQPIAIADTHLNSRAASGVAVSRADAAYRLQIAQARRFLDTNVSPRSDLIFAGDFNVGHDAQRIATANGTGGFLPGSREATMQAATLTQNRTRDLSLVLSRAKDKQYYRPGSASTLTFRSLDVPFGAARGGFSLSDHLGYVVNYAM